MGIMASIFYFDSTLEDFQVWTTLSAEQRPLALPGTQLSAQLPSPKYTVLLEASCPSLM